MLHGRKVSVTIIGTYGIETSYCVQLSRIVLFTSIEGGITITSIEVNALCLYGGPYYVLEASLMIVQVTKRMMCTNIEGSIVFY